MAYSPPAETSSTEMEQASPFLNLSGELRNRVYRYVLIADVPVDVTNRTTPKEPALLGCCKQIRLEALPVYYHENSFEVRLVHVFLQNSYKALTWLSALGQARSGLVFNFQLKTDIRLEISKPCEQSFKSISQQQFDRFVKARVGTFEQYYGVLTLQTARWIVGQLVAGGLSGNAIHVPPFENAKTWSEVFNTISKNKLEQALDESLAAELETERADQKCADPTQGHK